MPKTKSPATFKIGDAVRVKSGVTDPDFPDVPLGGWSGTVADSQKGKPPTYLVRLDDRTLKNIHPVYAKRCERDGLEADRIWLAEDDLEPDTGEPVEIEQPINIVIRPLDLKDQDDRIRLALGLTGDDPLPEVNDELLRTYYEYLAAKLSLPFEARYSAQTGSFRSRPSALKVVELLDPEQFPGDEYGLLCGARRNDQHMEVPLIDIEVAKGDPNKQLIADYSYWFVNW
jgi:hypothetical protein